MTLAFFHSYKLPVYSYCHLLQSPSKKPKLLDNAIVPISLKSKG